MERPWFPIRVPATHQTSLQGHVFILTAIDAYTRYLVAVPIRNKTATTVASALIEHVFLPLGAYRCLVSDQGREFCNEVLEEVTQLFGIDKLRTMAYRASANGRIERVHRTLNTLLRRLKMKIRETGRNAYLCLSQHTTLRNMRQLNSHHTI